MKNERRVFEVVESGQIIIMDEQFETFDCCEGYDQNGNKTGCENAGCYSLDNGYDHWDVLKDISYELMTEDEADRLFYKWEKESFGFSDALDHMENIRGFYRAKDKIERHVECDGYNIWTGSKFITLIVDSDDPNFRDLYEADNEKRILKDLQIAFDNGRKEATGGDDIYVGNRYVFLFIQRNIAEFYVDEIKNVVLDEPIEFYPELI